MASPHLRAVSAADAEPDAVWIKSVDDMAADLKARSDGVIGCSFDLDGSMTLLLAGNIAPDAAAGFMARCLASLANQAGDE